MKKLLLKELIKELFALDEMQETYLDGNFKFSISSTKEDNTLTIKVSLEENKDKEEFENWIQTIDDSLFQETIEKIGQDIVNLYTTDQYQTSINSFKDTLKQVIDSRKQNYLKEIEKLDILL